MSSSWISGGLQALAKGLIWPKSLSILSADSAAGIHLTPCLSPSHPELCLLLPTHYTLTRTTTHQEWQSCWCVCITSIYGTFATVGRKYTIVLQLLPYCMEPCVPGTGVLTVQDLCRIGVITYTYIFVGKHEHELFKI